jgi:hypothetical protein
MFESKKIEKFWLWFEKNQHQLAEVYDHPERLEKLARKARRISKDLEFLYAQKDMVNILFVSCGGLKAGIEIVKNTVAQAPTMQNWNIVAFKQPMPDDEIGAGNVSITYGDDCVVDAYIAQMDIEPNGDKYDLVIYSPADSMQSDHMAAYFILLDLLIGEYNVMTKLAGIEMVEQDGKERPKLIDIRKTFL